MTTNNKEIKSGYMSKEYVDSLAHVGHPLHLPNAQGWLLERDIPNSDYKDATGVFPIFNCQNWAELSNDIQNINENIISITLVADPFSNVNLSTLESCFPDKLLKFKDRLVVDLDKPLEESVTRHHRKCSRQALKKFEIKHVTTPIDILDEWIKLHDNLKDKNNISGAWDFSRESLVKQLNAPGATVFTATYEGEYVGAQIWMHHESVAYGHLVALNETGYRLGASYALYWYALNHFNDNTPIRWCDIGGEVSADSEGGEGLMKFKSGWTKETVTPYLCGRILQPKKYNELILRTQTQNNLFFPAYRSL